MIVIPSAHGIWRGAPTRASLKVWNAQNRRPVINPYLAGRTFTNAQILAGNNPPKLIFSTFNDAFDAIIPYDRVGHVPGTSSATKLSAADQRLTPAGASLVSRYLQASSTWKTAPLDLSVTGVGGVSSPGTVGAFSFWLWWDAYSNDNSLAWEYSSVISTTTNGINFNPNNTALGLITVGFGWSHGGLNDNWIVGWPRSVAPAAMWHHFAFNVNRIGVNLTASVPSMWIDGVKTAPTGSQTTNVLNTPNGQFTGPDTMHFMSRNSASNFGTGRLAFFNVFDDYLTPQDAMQLYLNPGYALRPRQVWQAS